MIKASQREYILVLRAAAENEPEAIFAWAAVIVVKDPKAAAHMAAIIKALFA